MIASFYKLERDKNKKTRFVGLQNNASLSIDNKSYKLIKRPVEMNELSCRCEPFTEDIQPTFLVISDDYGRYIYGSLAGIPLLNEDNQTEINGTDLKSMLSSDVIMELKEEYFTVNDYIDFIFSEWENQVNQNSFKCVLEYKEDCCRVEIDDKLYQPIFEKKVYNAWEEIKCFLKAYDLYIDTELDLINSQVIFIIGKIMKNPLNIKLWEYGIKNYGKWVANINECQGYCIDKDGIWKVGFIWILNSRNNMVALKKIDKRPEDTIRGEKNIIYWIEKEDIFYLYDEDSKKWIITENPRDIYPIKRKVVISEEDLDDANYLAASELFDSKYNENIELSLKDVDCVFENQRLSHIDNNNNILKSENVIYPDFETKFVIYVNKGEGKYKELPCGELHFDSSGLVKFQIGWRYTSVEFI